MLAIALKNIIENEFELPGIYGLSDLDMRHRLIVSPSYSIEKPVADTNWVMKNLVGGLTLSGTLTVQSGTPYSAHVGGDPNNDRVQVLDILPGTGRNQFTTPWVYVLDARVSKSFHFGERLRMTLIANGYNVFNRSNVAAENETIYNFNGATTTPTALPARLTPVLSFGSPRAFVPPTQGTGPATATANRTFQIGLKVDF